MSEKRLSLKRPESEDSSKKEVAQKGGKNSARKFAERERELLEKNALLSMEMTGMKVDFEKKVEELENKILEFQKANAEDDEDSEFVIRREDDVVSDGVSYEKFREATWFEWFVWGNCYYAPNRRKFVEKK